MIIDDEEDFSNSAPQALFSMASKLYQNLPHGEVIEILSKVAVGSLVPVTNRPMTTGSGNEMFCNGEVGGRFAQPVVSLTDAVK
jgi:hypothetical protein